MNESSRFIGEQVTVEFDQPPQYSKRPNCPDRFIWAGTLFQVTALLQEWRDYSRRGKMRFNMRPENLNRAKRSGSWGVGRYYFRVQVADGRLFDIYYDRAPKGQKQKEGAWYIFQEILPAAGEGRSA